MALTLVSSDGEALGLDEGIILGYALGEVLGYTLGYADETELHSSDGYLMVPMMTNL